MSDEEVPPIVHALSGAVASVFSNSFVYPLDLITTRLQTQDKKKSRAANGKPLTHEKSYDGLRHALFTIYEDEGITSMWEGVWADNVSTMASTFCYHFAYNAIRDRRFDAATKRNGGKRPRVLGMVEELTIGASAGVIARFVTSPASNIVTRSQTQGGPTTEIIKSIWEEKGITGFWSGMKASVILAANPSISYYLFEVQKALLVPKSRRNNPKAIEIFLMSAFGKAIATLILYPVILLKARTQAMRVKASLWELVKSILEKDGIAGLYDGVVPQVLKGFLSQGILMLLKDRIATLIISGYLSISRGKRQVPSTSYYFSDSPKTDLNGLIAATKDSVEVAVDQVVDKVKEVAIDVSDGLHLEGAYESAKEMAASARETTGIDGALAKVQEVASSVTTTLRDSTDSLPSLQTGREKVEGSIGAVNASLTAAVKEGGERANAVVGSIGSALDSTRAGVEETNVRAISNAVGQSSFGGGSVGASIPAAVDGVEWKAQTNQRT